MPKIEYNRMFPVQQILESQGIPKAFFLSVEDYKLKMESIMPEDFYVSGICQPARKHVDCRIIEPKVLPQPRNSKDA